MQRPSKRRPSRRSPRNRRTDRSMWRGVRRRARALLLVRARPLWRIRRGSARLDRTGWRAARGRARSRSPPHRPRQNLAGLHPRVVGRDRRVLPAAGKPVNRETGQRRGGKTICQRIGLAGQKILMLQRTRHPAHQVMGRGHMLRDSGGILQQCPEPLVAGKPGIDQVA